MDVHGRGNRLTREEDEVYTAVVMVTIRSKKAVCHNAYTQDTKIRNRNTHPNLDSLLDRNPNLYIYFSVTAPKCVSLLPVNISLPFKSVHCFVLRALYCCT